MAVEEAPSSLSELLDRLLRAGTGAERVSLVAVLEVAGRRAFGPALLVPGLVALSPLSGIPGMPSMMGIVVVLIAGQLLLGRQEFWLPGVVARRTVRRHNLERAVRFLRPLARFADRMMRPRLSGLTEGGAVHLIAAFCVLIAITMPPLELVPLAATSAGAALTALGLALIGRDGLLALIALLFCGVSISLIGIGLHAATG